MPYLKINYDDSKPTFEELNLPDSPIAWLHACYNALGCRSIETTSTVLRDIVLVIDEEGKLFDGWENRINKVASLFHGSVWDFIAGDAILARVSGCDLVPLTFDDLDRILNHSLF